MLTETPKTLLEAVTYFSDAKVCFESMLAAALTLNLKGIER